MDLSMKSLLLISLVFLIYISSADSIRCFECNSIIHGSCATLEKTHLNSPFLVECKDTPKRKHFCRKTDLEIKVDILENQMHRRIIRSCGYTENYNKKECYYRNDDDHKEVNCQCFEDACNSSQKMTVFSIFILLSSAVVLFI